MAFALTLLVISCAVCATYVWAALESDRRRFQYTSLDAQVAHHALYSQLTSIQQHTVRGSISAAQLTQTFGLITLPLHAAYQWNPAERMIITQMIANDGSSYDYAMMQVPLSWWGPEEVGRPTHYSFDGQEIRLYPTPDREYRLSWGAYDADALRAQAAGWNARVFNDILQPVFNPADPDAEKKSLALLREWLTPEQQEDFLTKGHFHCVGSKTKARYRITSGRTYNVYRLNGDGTDNCKMCFIPALPDGTMAAIGDVMLAQKIMLENDEEKALNIANFSGRADCLINPENWQI